MQRGVMWTKTSAWRCWRSRRSTGSLGVLILPQKQHNFRQYVLPPSKP